MKLSEETRRLIEKAYLLGFMASGEGHNGEYPFEQRGIEPEACSGWRERREQELNELMVIIE